MDEKDGLVFAYRLDGKGGGAEVGWDEIERWEPSEGLLWIHLDFTDPRGQRWLEEESGVDPVICEALIADESRPRTVTTRDGMLVILRGVNLNPGSDPDDMISIRMWIDKGKVITLRRRRLMAVEDLRAAVASGEGPTDAGGFLVDLSNRLVARMSTVIEDLDDSVDAVEDEILTAESPALRSKIGTLRRQAIGLRRYLSPQRDAMARLQSERVSWLDDMDRVHLREIADRTTRYVEDLDAARDRAAVTQEELGSRLSEQMNRTMFALSIVAGIFLPLGLLTGLLGINVGGIPGTESPWAFAVVCAILAVVAVFQIVIFRRIRWL